MATKSALETQLAVVAGLLAGTLGLVGGPLGSVLAGGGVFAVAVFLALLFALDSALAGAVGGLLG